MYMVTPNYVKYVMRKIWFKVLVVSSHLPYSSISQFSLKFLHLSENVKNIKFICIINNLINNFASFSRSSREQNISRRNTVRHFNIIYRCYKSKESISRTWLD